jgi:hypothetical protein
MIATVCTSSGRIGHPPPAPIQNEPSSDRASLARGKAGDF